MIIDAHHHFSAADGYAERLADACRAAGIDRVCLLGAGSRSLGRKDASNEQVMQAVERRPDLFIGFATFNLGLDAPSRVDEYAARGFAGIKFICPAANYDDRAYFPVYARMEAHGIPGLFHLGIVMRTPHDRAYDIDNNRHRPVYLDTLARAFPGLTLIGAHLGNPWYEEAAMAARWNPNLYFDLTGSTLKCKRATFIGDLLWWTPTSRYRSPDGTHAWEKIVFGTDVGAGEVGDVLADYRRVMAELGVPADIQAKVLGGTLARVLKLS